ncbi:hypothetical protein DX933_17465 [Ornithinibacillus gellani]|uniref:CD3324 family protein n=1 Tax=Ornithinibacillus gellani TaxID=2293253 RepID=UPI000F4AEA6A|nr:CD3324 family protein [Ornithinibacillus gellani]TQS70554.1 hypothetical protein DX933_17465 [Ornithinibacillus gellani]
MDYINASQILPKELVQLIQTYVDGKPLYIPRKQEGRKAWGESNGTREWLQWRNKQIYEGYLRGNPTADLARNFFLSEKSIQRIIRQEKSCPYVKKM